MNNRLLSLLLAAAVLPAAFAQNVTVQKTPAVPAGANANKLTDSSKVMVVGDGGSISATGTGQINATSVAGGSISPTAPLTGGGPISGTVVIGIPKATSSVDGYLFHTDWSTFNAKQSALSFTAPIVNSAGTVAMAAATGSVNGYLTSADWTTFNGKENVLTFSPPLARATNAVSIPASTNSVDGYLTAADHTTFAAKQPAGNYLTALTGDVSAAGPGSAAATLASVASAGTTGSSTAIPVVTIDVKGRTTSISTAAVVAPAGTLTGTTLASGVVSSSLTSVGTISTGVWNGTAIANAYLANSTVTIGTTSIALGGSTSTVGGLNSITSATTQSLTLATLDAGNIVLSPFNSGLIGGGFTVLTAPTYPASNAALRWGGGNRFGLFAGPDATANGVVDHVGGFGYNFQGTAADTQMTLQMEDWYKGTATTAVSEFHYNWGGVIGGTNQNPRRIFQFTTSLGPDYGSANPISGWTDAAFFVNTFYVSKQGLYDDHGLFLDFSGATNVMNFAGNEVITGNSTAANYTTSGVVTAPNVNVTAGSLFFEVSGGGNISGSSGAITAATASNANFNINAGTGSLIVTGGKIQLAKGVTTAQVGAIGGGSNEVLVIGADNGGLTNVNFGVNAGGTGYTWQVGGVTKLTLAPSGAITATANFNGTNGVFSGQIGGGNGSAGSPTFTNVGFTSGLYFNSNVPRISSAGTYVVEFGASTVAFQSTIDATTTAGGASGAMTLAGGLYAAKKVISGNGTFDGTTGTISGMTTLTGANSMTSVALSDLTLATGTSGTALTIASATNLATFAANVRLANYTSNGFLTTTSGNGTLAVTSAAAFTSGTLSGLTGLAVRDTSAAFDVTLAATSSTALTAGRTLTLDLVNAARTLKLTGNPTLADWFDQSVKSTASPTFVGATFSGAISGITTLGATSTITTTGGKVAVNKGSTTTQFAVAGGGNEVIVIGNDNSGATELLMTAHTGGVGVALGIDSVAYLTTTATSTAIAPTTASTTTSTGSLVNAGGFGNAGDLHNGGNVYADTAGKTLIVKSGSNAAAGTVTLVAGAATITSTAIDANTVILFSEKTAGGTPGVYQPLAAVSSGSAAVTSAATDTSTYNWVAMKEN